MSQMATEQFYGHICGCYFYDSINYRRAYLPQVELSSNTVINPVCFTTTLSQTFHNPNDKVLPQLRYTFPLYDGVAVCEYRIRYGDHVLKGIVRQKEEAKQTYDAAIQRGETAGLLDSLPAGIYGTTIGNLPPKTDVVVELKYCGELKHDAEIDGLRYNLPTAIAPRYGNYPGSVLESNASARGMSITVGIDMGKAAIRKVQSPSHPIAVSMGGDDKTFNPAEASASLTLGTAELAGDFVLQILVDDMTKPQAVIETHPTLQGQRAIMTTLVPKFVLKDDTHHPEIIFIADQSGSMSGAKNDALVKALRVFLKSLPFGVRFNVAAFGNDYKFLWPKSAAYNESNLTEALSFVNSFKASYGGTKILEPICHAFESRLKDMPLEIMLLTDGEVWNESAIFTYVNEQIRDKAVNARVFALGIGSDVSHSLVEGLTRAGNGFAQFVTHNEQTDQKVVRMLKGALYPHTTDYSIDVNYSDAPGDTDDYDDFELVEKVVDCLHVRDTEIASTSDGSKTIAPGSFYDDSADLEEPKNKRHAGRYAHLPAVDTPRVLQAPHTIPSLYPFNRSTLYFLLGPDSSQKSVSSITIRASAAQGPLELKIPITFTQQGTTVHSLGARKAVQDLEEGRGWLTSANSGTDGKLLKQRYGSRFDELVEREAVRLGERFQVAGKWCSFVAVDERETAVSADGTSIQPSSAPGSTSGDSTLYEPTIEASPLVMEAMSSHVLRSVGTANSLSVDHAKQVQHRHSQLQKTPHFCRMPAKMASRGAPSPKGSQSPTLLSRVSGGVLGGRSRKSKEVENIGSEGMFGTFSVNPQPPVSAYGHHSLPQSPISAYVHHSLPPPPPPAAHFQRTSAAVEEAADEEKSEDQPQSLQPYQVQLMLLEQQNKKRLRMARQARATPDQVIRELIDQQQFSGAWNSSTFLFPMLGAVNEDAVRSALNVADPDCVATLLVLAYFERKLGDKKEVWELVATKALRWLQSQNLSENSDALVEKAKIFIP